jgi:tetratricopeptide (TPR) repeat protein
MATASDPVVDEARESYDAGDFEAARDKAVAGLAERPDDAALLRIAGLSGIELDDPEAIGYLQKVTEITPDDPDAWRELGGSLTMSGRLDEAGAAFRKATELRPSDTRVLVDLGHVVLGSGQVEEALPYFEQAREHEPGNTEALPALVEVYRRAGRLEDGLAVAKELSDVRPDDVVAALDVADLALELDRLDEAEAACRRARGADDDPEHEVFLLHALIELEIRRERWRRALDLAVEATRVDRLGRTTDVLAFVVAQVFGEPDRPAPPREEVERALADSRAEHRRLHLEAVGI